MNKSLAIAAVIARARAVIAHNPLLRPGGAAAFLGVTTCALRRWRVDRCGPSFFELPAAREGGRPIIRYSVADLKEWIAARNKTKR